jgi:hypothetical protein
LSQWGLRGLDMASAQARFLSRADSRWSKVEWDNCTYAVAGLLLGRWDSERPKWSVFVAR